MVDHDLLILGGGMTGVSTALFAARFGWSVTLIERSDLASGASGASSHMLHGGLRYLEQGRLGLVGESLHERTRLLESAPDFARELRFLIVHRPGDRIGPGRARLGLWLYDRLAGKRALSLSAGCSTDEAVKREPALRTSGMTGGGLYSDAVVDDAALVAAIARDAAASGGVIQTWSELRSLRRDGDRFVVEYGDRLAPSPGPTGAVRARFIVNATGAATDATRAWIAAALDRVPPPPLLTPSRGIHLIYPALTREHALLYFARKDGRVLFVIPFGGRSLVGTTETEIRTPPVAADFEPSRGEVDYLRRELAALMPEAADVRPLGVYAGLRPLLASGGEVGRATREHRILEDDGIITVAGGKFTTARVMARDLLHRLAPQLGAKINPSDIRFEWPSKIVRWNDGDDPEELASVGVEQLHARKLTDLLRRRTRAWLKDDHGRGMAPRLAHAMGRRLGWSTEREEAEVAGWNGELTRQEELIG